MNSKNPHAMEFAAVLLAIAALMAPLSFAETGQPNISAVSVNLQDTETAYSGVAGPVVVSFPIGTVVGRNATTTMRELTFNEKVKLYRDVIGTGSERQFDLRKVENLAKLRKADKERFESVAELVKKADQRDRAELVEELSSMEKRFVARISAKADDPSVRQQIKSYAAALKEQRKHVRATERNDDVGRLFSGNITREQFIETVWKDL